MGLPGPRDNIKRAAKRFSSDVLKIEIVGPQQQHLSVVDVPGITLILLRYSRPELTADLV